MFIWTYLKFSHIIKLLWAIGYYCSTVHSAMSINTDWQHVLPNHHLYHATLNLTQTFSTFSELKNKCTLNWMYYFSLFKTLWNIIFLEDYVTAPRGQQILWRVKCICWQKFFSCKCHFKSGVQLKLVCLKFKVIWYISYHCFSSRAHFRLRILTLYTSPSTYAVHACHGCT